MSRCWKLMPSLLKWLSVKCHWDCCQYYLIWCACIQLYWSGLGRPLMKFSWSAVQELGLVKWSEQGLWCCKPSRKCSNNRACRISIFLEWLEYDSDTTFLHTAPTSFRKRKPTKTALNLIFYVLLFSFQFGKICLITKIIWGYEFGEREKKKGK